MSGTVNSPRDYLAIFYPQYFDPADPSYIDDRVMQTLLEIAEEFRPHCLRESLQNIAVAYYAAYLIDGYLKDQSGGGSGGGGGTNSGIVLSEREGDTAITYANPLSGVAPPASTLTKPSDPWEQWNNLAKLCRYGAITTRAGSN